MRTLSQTTLVPGFKPGDLSTCKPGVNCNVLLNSPTTAKCKRTIENNQNLRFFTIKTLLPEIKSKYEKHRKPTKKMKRYLNFGVLFL